MAGEMSTASKIFLLCLVGYFAFYIVGIIVLSLLQIPLMLLGT